MAPRPAIFPAAAIILAALTVGVNPPSSQAAALDAGADECAIQRALLGQAAPDCPPEPPPPPPIIPPAAPPLTVEQQRAPPPTTKLPAAPPAIPAVAPPAGQPAPSAERAADFLILFDFGSNRISAASEPLLTRIAAVMNAPAAAGARFRIVGHTDGVGSADANLTLSQRRAAAVKIWLVQRGAVAAGRLEASGMGESKPADPARPDAAVNRRVEIIAQPAGK